MVAAQCAADVALTGNLSVGRDTWLGRHFGAGIILSSTSCSILAWMLIEWKWPWFLQPAHRVAGAVWGWIVAAGYWLVADVTLSRWWYWLLTLYLVGTLAGLGWLLMKHLVLEPRASEYTKDIIYGLVWRWRWGKEDIYSLAPFCPHCDRQPTLSRCDDRLSQPYELKFDFIYRDHGPVHRISGTYQEFEEQVKDEIRLKLRNGTWKQVARQWLQR